MHTVDELMKLVAVYASALRRSDEPAAYTAGRALRAALESALKPQEGWISVDERLPPACQFVLVYRFISGKYRVDIDYISSRPAECVEDDRISHWISLPAAPQHPGKEG